MAEIVAGVHRIEGLRGGRGGPNVYLLVDGDALALIDAGLPGNIRTISRYVEKLGRPLEQLRYILLTHSHPDHTGGAPALRKRTGAAVLAHPGDVRFKGREASVSYLGMFGSSSLPLPFFRRVPADGLLTDGEILPVLGGLRVLHTPGHTPGSLCFHLEKAGVLFCGDLIVEDRGVLGKNHAFPGSDLKAYQASLARLASLHYDVLCLGHGQPVVGDAMKQVQRLAESDVGFDVSWRIFGGRGRASS